MSVTAVLNLNTAGFTSGIQTVNKSLQAIGKTAAKAGALIGSGMSAGIEKMANVAQAGAAAMVGVLAGLGAGVFEAMTEGGELVDLQEQTGVTVQKLMALRVAFEQAGLGAGDVQPTIAKLQKTIVDAQTGSESAQKAFEALGISADELAQTTADEQLQRIGDAIAKIENPALKSAVAMEVFGKSGGRMLAFFASGGLDDASQAIGKQGDLMAKYADTFDAITDAFGLYHVKLRGFFVGIAAELAPVLKIVSDFFKGLDFAQLGESVGNTIASIYGAIQNGDLSGLLTSALKIGFGGGINFFAAGIKATFLTVVDFFKTSFSGMQDYFSGFGTILLGVGKQFASMLLDAVASVLISMRELPGIGEKFAAAGSGLQTTAFRMSVAGNEAMQQGADKMSNALPTLDAFGSRLVNSAKTFAAEFGKAQETPVIDVSKEQEKLNAIMASGREKAAAMQLELGAKVRVAEAPVLERDILSVLGKQEGPSRAQQVFGMFGTLGAGTVRGSFQTLDPMVSQQKQTNALLRQVAANTAKGPVVAAPAYQQ